MLRHRREALLNALADDDHTPTSSPDVALARAKPAAQLASDFERFYGRRPVSRHPDYLRRRLAWAVQAVKLGGWPEPISGNVMELKGHLPERWREVFAGVGQGARDEGASGAASRGEVIRGERGRDARLRRLIHRHSRSPSS